MGIATLILGLLPTILKNIPGISAKIQQIITDITASTSAVLASGVTSQPSINTVLAAWLGVINALKADPTFPQNALGSLAQVEKIVQATLLEDETLAKSIDWSKLQPITPVP